MKIFSAITVIFLFYCCFSIYTFASCDDVWIEKVNIRALEDCRVKAESGDKDAQFDYGLLLIRLPEDYQNIPEAIKWIQKSAINKHYLSQVALGKFLSGEMKSDQFPINLPESYAWYLTANEFKASDRIKAKMKPEEVKKAEKLAGEYITKYQAFKLIRLKKNKHLTKHSTGRKEVPGLTEFPSRSETSVD